MVCLFPLIALDVVTYVVVAKVLPINHNLLQLSNDITLYLFAIAGISFVLIPSPYDKADVYVRRGRRSLLWLQLCTFTYTVKVPLIVVGWAVYKWLGY